MRLVVCEKGLIRHVLRVLVASSSQYPRVEEMAKYQVTETPDARKGKTLPAPVHEPEKVVEEFASDESKRRGSRYDYGAHKVDPSGEEVERVGDRQMFRDIEQTAECRPLEEVLWYCIVQVLELDIGRTKSPLCPPPFVFRPVLEYLVPKHESREN